MIGKRLKLARSAAGLSLRELQTKIENRVMAQVIGKYERNEAMPGSAALITLADALDVSVDYLLGDPDMVFEIVEFRRKQANTSKREISQVEAKALYLVERYLLVEELLHLPSIKWHSPRGAPVMRDVSEADLAARNLRAHWCLGGGPISNLAELLEKRGIKVLAVDLTKRDGLTARVRCAGKEAVPVIVVNRKICGEHQRFTLAHELGHMVMAVAARLDGEEAARRFAGVFLMPADVLWTEVGKHRTAIEWEELFELKQLFGVSVQAITYRCKDLGIFSEAMFRRLSNDFDRFGWRHPPYREPYARQGEEPKRFTRLTFRAFAEDVISASKAAELLDISVRDLNRRMDELLPDS
ncbi:MAG: XRE family transcriptional regulator [Nitrospira sp.]|nr:XRE family transcriptional regulator [Nitrospira sp.]